MLMPVRTTAPMKADTPRGAPRGPDLGVDVPLTPVARPLTSVVGSLAAWVAAEAAAGLAPSASRTVADVTPKPMPNVPSTSWASPPARAKARMIPMPIPPTLPTRHAATDYSGDRC
jgi:hypothetical protein